MSREKELHRLRSHASSNDVITHHFAAAVPFRRILRNALLAFLPLTKDAGYLVGLSKDSILILTLSGLNRDRGLVTIPAQNIVDIRVSRGSLRTKVRIATATAVYDMRIGHLGLAHGAREALDALATFPRGVAHT